MDRYERRRWHRKLTKEAITGTIAFGINGYLGIVLFILIAVCLANIYRKVFYKKTTLKYTGLLSYSGLGILTFIFLRLLNFNFLYNKQGFWLALMINIILFIIVRQIKKRKNN